MYRSMQLTIPTLTIFLLLLAGCTFFCITHGVEVKSNSMAFIHSKIKATNMQRMGLNPEKL
jgi:hypothetical protein